MKMYRSVVHFGSSRDALLGASKAWRDGRERPHIALMRKQLQQMEATIYSARQAWDIEIYNIKENVRPAEVAIDFGLRPVGPSSIGRWCLR